MYRIAVDTNILVSAVIAQGNEFRLLQLAKDGKLAIGISPHILKEFAGVIARQKFGFSEEQVMDACKEILGVSVLVMPDKTASVITEDPVDNRVLECAEAFGAKYILSGDEHIVRLREYKGMKIVRTARFLEIMGSKN